MELSSNCSCRESAFIQRVAFLEQEPIGQKECFMHGCVQGLRLRVGPCLLSNDQENARGLCFKICRERRSHWPIGGAKALFLPHQQSLPRISLFRPPPTSNSLPSCYTMPFPTKSFACTDSNTGSGVFGRSLQGMQDMKTKTPPVEPVSPLGSTTAAVSSQAPFFPTISFLYAGCRTRSSCPLAFVFPDIPRFDGVAPLHPIFLSRPSLQISSCQSFPFQPGCAFIFYFGLAGRWLYRSTLAVL